MNDSPSFEFIFSLVKPDKNKALQHESIVKLKPKQLFARIEEMQLKNLPTFSQLLFDKYPDRKYEYVPESPQLDMSKLAGKGFKMYEAEKARQHLEPARSVVDLHIERLTDNWERMSNYEILQLQMKTFEKYYELALHHHLPVFTVIHGIGEGVLRNEIHDALRLKKDVKSFVNQYHPNFGYGATEIFFQY
jgi:endonuclease III